MALADVAGVEGLRCDHNPLSVTSEKGNKTHFFLVLYLLILLVTTVLNPAPSLTVISTTTSATTKVAAFDMERFMFGRLCSLAQKRLNFILFSQFCFFVPRLGHGIVHRVAFVVYLKVSF